MLPVLLDLDEQTNDILRLSNSKIHGKTFFESGTFYTCFPERNQLQLALFSEKAWSQVIAGGPEVYGMGIWKKA